MALATQQDAVVLELMRKGQESAAYLGDLLRAASPASPHQELAAEILRCCDRVIATLRASGGSKRKACSPAAMPPRQRSRGPEALRVVRSGTMVDGFIWRKYGQKDINGRKHPRLYHRCAYRDQGCKATRRVQRTQEEDESAAYEIAYYGEHTCQGGAAPPPPAVVDFGSNAWASAPAAVHQLWSWDGEISMSSQGGWSASAASSEGGFEAQMTHEWHDTAPVEEEQSAAAPDFASDLTVFLDGSFDWASVINDPFDFHTAPLL